MTETRDQKQLFLSRVDQHKGILYRVARSYTRNAEDIEDLIQEAIAALWRSYPSYDESRRWSTWMYRITLNVAISYFRKESRRSDTFLLLKEDVIEGRSAEEEDNDQIEQLYRFIHQLKKLDRALMLLYLDDYSHHEIAEILGITKTNVATKISRIKALLKQQFSQLNEG